MPHGLVAIDPNHPLISQEYAVYTRSIDEMALTIGNWVDQRQPGGYIHGPSRFGKSRGIKWFLREALADRFGEDSPLHLYIRPPGPSASESAFWRGLLRGLRHKLAETRKSADILREMTRQFLMTSCAAAGTNYVVLIIDEAQDMTVKEWGWLHGLQNDLDFEGFRLSVFSIASHQIAYQYDLLASAHFSHYAARFMVAHWRFPGLSCEAEVEFVLNGYDTDSEWPAGSGLSFLGYFAPAEYERGERLHHQAAVVWRVMKALLPPKYKLEACGFPMQHLAWATEEVIKQLGRGVSWDEATSPDAWLKSLHQTGLTDHMRLIAAGVL